MLIYKILLHMNIKKLSNKTMIEYPLYDELVNKVKNRTDANIDIYKVCLTINNITQYLKNEAAIEHYREICALILHHYQITNKTNPTNFPYNPLIMPGGKGLRYNIMELPPMLQQILAQYIDDNVSK